MVHCTRMARVVHPICMVRCAILACALAVPLAAQTLDDVFAKMDKTAAQFKSVTADIKRDVHVAVINDDTIETGTIKVKRDKPHETRMLIEFTKPDPKTVWFDGTTGSVYYPKIKTVQVYDIGTKRNLVDQFLLLGFGASGAELKDAYMITWVGAESIEGQPTGHIQLIPKSPDLLRQLKKAELWISAASGLPVQEKIFTSTNGDFTLVTYSNMNFNPSLSDNALKPSYPKGVEVQHPKL
jgi:outer membrane lipoprotein-sorting protein